LCWARTSAWPSQKSAQVSVTKGKDLVRSILKLVMSGNLKELVVASRDRLAIFGTERITWLITRSGGRVFFHNQIDAAS